MLRAVKMARSVWCLTATLSLWSGLCVAGPKVEIRIIPRPKPEVALDPLAGPIPFREPAAPTGPFSGYVDSIGCIKGANVDMDGQSVLIDICHLKNVTITREREPLASQVTVVPVSADTDTGAASTSIAVPVLEEDGSTTLTEAHAGSTSVPEAGGNSPAELNDAEVVEVSNESLPPKPETKILGIFKGWKMDPISTLYKHAVFDDGDLCGDYGERYSIEVEVVRSPNTDNNPRTFDFRELSKCKYAVRVEVYISEYELKTYSGIHSPGILDLSDPEETLPRVCGERKCKYGPISGKVSTVLNEVQSVKQSLNDLISSESTSVSTLTLSSATSIIKSSTDIMERALELLQAIEEIHVETKAFASESTAAAPVEQTETVAAS